MKFRLLLLTLVCCLAAGLATSAEDDFTLYLVRHAEKQDDGSRDPFLTEAGQERAKRLAAWLKAKGIDDIWSSGYRRTINTAQPLATELGRLVNIYDPGNQPLLVEKLLRRKDNALIVLTSINYEQNDPLAVSLRTIATGFIVRSYVKFGDSL